ncbi:hypothetical protein BGZ65_010549, partial [Modicella reniformis]
MTRLRRKDNHMLRKQEWRLLFGTGAGPVAHAQPAAPVSSSFPSQEVLLQTQTPSSYSQETFLVKSFFSEAEKYYLVLITNFK